jgi:MscS family membrane protein
VAARLFSYLVERIVTRSRVSDAGSVERRMAVALRHPVTFLMFLMGAWAAVHRLALPPAWTRRADAALFVVAVVLLAVAAARFYAVLLGWYAAQEQTRGEHVAKEFAPLFNKLGRTFIAIVAVIMVLQHLGVDVASLVVSLGVGSLAVGLAAQDTLSNMFAGFAIMLDRPFRVGDRVQLSTGEIGMVEAIGMRATLLRTPEETTLIVPNSTLVRDRIVNHTRPSRGAIGKVELGVDYASDLDAVRAVLLAATAGAPDVDHDQPATVVFTRFGDLAIQVLLTFRVRDYARLGAARSQVQEQVHRRFREQGILIPTVPRFVSPAAATKEV